MNIKDILSDNILKPGSMIDAQYYSYVYKKTEKIVCAVFLITDTAKDRSDIKDVILDTRNRAKQTLLSVVDMMVSLQGIEEREVAERVRDLLSLRSLLYVLVSTRGARAELVEVLVREIDGVIEHIYKAYNEKQKGALSQALDLVPHYAFEERQKRVALSARVVRRVGQGGPDGTQSRGPISDTGRREGILGIVRERGVVSIKDISDTIKDCSEKTLQRELIDLIKDGLVKKEGERRWSRYSIL